MNKNLATLIGAAVVSIAYLVLANFVPSSCDGFGCVGTGMARAFIYFVVIPVVFGILGFALSKENRLRQGLLSLGIALATAIVVVTPVAVRNYRQSHSGAEILQGDQKDLSYILQSKSIVPEEAVPTDNPAREEHLGFLRSVYGENGKYFLTIDYADWLNGKEAVQAMFEDGRCELPADLNREEAARRIAALEPDSSGFDWCGLSNGYYIRNRNPKLRTFEIPAGLFIEYWSIGKPQPDGTETGYLAPAVLAKVFSGEISEQSLEMAALSPRSNPYRITLQNGVLSRIEIVYVP